MFAPSSAQGAERRRLAVVGSQASRPQVVAALLLATLLTGAAAPAFAQDSEAQLHFELGEELYRQRRYLEALEHFLSSQRIAPTVRLATNIAQVYALADRPIEAYNWYETVLTEFEPDASLRAETVAARDALAARVALLEVRTTPPGAELFLDRPDLGAIGRSPRRVATTPGVHRLVARAQAHREASQELTIGQGQLETIELTLEPILGRLAIRSEPPGATVSAAGRAEPLGTTPLSLELPPGALDLRLTLEGYEEQARQVSIGAGELTELSFAFRRPPGSVAVLSVVTEPAGAEVLLEGRLIGRGPLSLGELEPGRYRLEIRAEGHEPWSEEILLEPGGATRGTVTLASARRRERRERLRWIGYGGGAAELVGGVVLGALALAHRAEFFASENPSRAELDRIRAEGIATDVLLFTGAAAVAVTLILDLVLRRRIRSRGLVTVDH